MFGLLRSQFKKLGPFFEFQGSITVESNDIIIKKVRKTIFSKTLTFFGCA